MASWCSENLKAPKEAGVEIPGFVPGEFIHLVPENQKTSIDIFTQLGTGSNLLLGLLFQLGKWGFTLVKFDEWSEISPVHAQYYQLTTQQKQILEGQIKQALAGIQTAVSDYELLQHDLRKYKEYADYFEQIEEARKKGDKETEKKINSTLKSIFIDMVDVNTGEGVSLRSIVSRWPTIIVDFLKLNDDDVDPKKVAQNKEYNFSQPEAYVLTTKNKLFVKWKEMFEETVKERYKHLLQLSNARRASIEQYREMVKPYIHRYRAIRELGETTEGRQELRQTSWFRSSVQAVSIDKAEYWAYRSYVPPDYYRVEQEGIAGEEVDILKLPIPKELKYAIKANEDKIPKNLLQQQISPNGIEPLDKWVLFFAEKMENEYKMKNPLIKLTIADLLKARKKLLDMMKQKEWWSPYFVLLDFSTFRTVLRDASGKAEFEDLAFDPISVYLLSQNAMLLRLLEIMLKEKEDELYISEMLGESAGGKKLADILKDQYPLLFSEESSSKDIEQKQEKKKIENFLNVKPIGSIGTKIKLIQSGKYETNFSDRITAFYFKDTATSVYVPVVRFIKSGAGVP